MATWIVHMRLAENLLERIAGLDPAMFAVGNIAPDSGIPDEKWETFTPPAHVTHLTDPDEPHPRHSRDLEFYRRYLAGRPWPDGDGERFSFLLGYFFHLVTDNLWADQIARLALERFAERFAADKDFIWEVKRDWYGLDFAYVRAHPESLFWRVFLDCGYDEDCLDFMPVEAVQQRIDYIQALYQREDEEVRAHYFERPELYLSQAEMDCFVGETTEHLERIYRLLWEERVDSLGYLSALELPLEN